MSEVKDKTLRVLENMVGKDVEISLIFVRSCFGSIPHPATVGK